MIAAAITLLNAESFEAYASSYCRFSFSAAASAEALKKDMLFRHFAFIADSATFHIARRRLR
jgi:hypothetical protein